MDNTELHYLSYDPDAVFEAMLEAYLDAGGDTIFGGDEKEILLRAVQAIIVQSFAGVDNALRMGTLRYAVGEYLDLIGETRGCERVSAASSTVSAVITETNDGVTNDIESGSVLTANGTRLFVLDSDVHLSGSGSTHTVTLTCSESGSLGNGVPSGSTFEFMVPRDGVASVVTSSVSSGGVDEEDDDTYRDRIRMHAASITTTGTALQYEAVAKGVSGSIIDAKALNSSAGVVGVYLILEPGSNSTAIVNAVRSALNGNDCRPLTDTVSVSVASAVNYTIAVEYRCDTGVDISAAVSEAISTYKEWQDNTIGQAFNPDRLMALLYQAGCTRVTWGTGSAFNGGSVAYTEISGNKRCLGTITAQRVN